MSFCTFSGEFTANMFTSVENRFITKYLPQANGDAVRVYLYGLYLCQRSESFDAENVAKLLKLSKEKLTEIFCFWEECDLVHILSRDPLFVEYLPVSTTVGKPKPLRPEKYADFNRAFYLLLQRAGKEFKPYEMQRILEFLEKEPMEQHAFLLVAEYCLKKDGNKLSSAHILNKAQKLCREGKFTYEQVEAELADFNVHENDIVRILSLIGIYRKPQESDYDFLEKWLTMTDLKTVYAAARHLKKGTFATLDLIIQELCDKGASTEESAEEYLDRRDQIVDTVYKVARKLGARVENPRAYADEYCEKWLDRGYDGDSLSLLASLCLRLGYGFAEMDTLLDMLYQSGIVDTEGVKRYCAAKDKDLKLLQRIQEICGVMKKTQSALDMISAWRSWSFSETMILEAAKRSAGASSPLPYMNKMLSEWKRIGLSAPSEIPERPASYREAAVTADPKAERERYYAALREKAISAAERMQERAARDQAFREADAACRREEIELARAEVFDPQKANEVRAVLERVQQAKQAALDRLGIREEDLSPRYTCRKCSDTGYLPNGTACDCYKK